MAGLGDAAQAIITKGLSCGKTTACENGTMLTAGPFTLFCVNPVVAGGAGGGGGYYPKTVTRPLQPGEIQHLYQPVPDKEQFYIVPREQEAEYLRRFLPVRIEIKIGKKTIEKQYMVPQDKARVLFNIVEVVNATKDRMKVMMSGMKRITTQAIVKVTNFRLRKPKR